MNDNKKFSIREYRQALYNDIVKKKKEQRKKWQAKYLQKLGHLNDFEKDKDEKMGWKEEEEEVVVKNQEKNRRPDSVNKSKEAKK